MKSAGAWIKRMVLPNKRLTFLFVGVAMVFGAATACAQIPPPDIKPRIPKGWTELPAWAQSGLPFDANPYYQIPESDNRETLYFYSFLSFSISDGSYFFPGLEDSEGFAEKRDQEWPRRERLSQFFDRYVGDDGQVVANAESRTEAQAIVAEFEEGLRQLEFAQQRSRCFFHCQVDPVSVSPHLHLQQSILWVLSLRALTDLDNLSAVQDARIGLRLKRDAQLLAENVGQVSLQRSEAICFDWIVRPILVSNGSSDEQLDELIEVLAEHYAAGFELDPVIEASRYEYLMLRDLMQRLESGEYAASAAERSSGLGRGDALPLPTLLVKELAAFGAYQPNRSVVDEELAELAASKPELAGAPEKLKELREAMAKEESPIPRLGANQADEMMLSLLLMNEFHSFTEDELAQEIAVLDERYRQIAAACALPYPESTVKLEVLSRDWTADDSWKQTKVLKWFQPVTKLPRVRVRSQLRTNAYLALAAAIRWHRQHGQPPPDLETALRDIGIDSVPVDVFSGEPLKMTVIDERVVVYSVGRDKDDDRAQRQFELYGGGATWPDLSENPDGDVIFQLNYALGQ